MNGKFVAYYRVSTARQGINGLGMNAQKSAVRNYLNGGNWDLIEEFSEVESGKVKTRKELQNALDLCRKKKATLLIAKLDRLARNASFLLNLQESGVKFIAVDMPYADNFTVGIMALVAQKERELISDRTKAGLKEAKRRGKKLGNPAPQAALKLAIESNAKKADAFAQNILPVITQIRKAGITSLRGIAGCLNARGFKSPTGKQFSPQSVKNLLKRNAD